MYTKSHYKKRISDFKDFRYICPLFPQRRYVLRVLREIKSPTCLVWIGKSSPQPSDLPFRREQLKGLLPLKFLKFSVFFCLVLFISVCPVFLAIAAPPPITIVKNYISQDALVMGFSVNAEKIFTEKTLKNLNIGFTIRTVYRVELWISRRFWFDKLEAQEEITCELNYDILQENYKCLISRRDKIEPKVSTKLKQVAEWITDVEPIKILTADEFDFKGRYYYTIKADIATLTTEDIQNLRRWLEDSDGEEGNESSISRATFRVISAFLSSRYHRKFSVESEKFRLKELEKTNNIEEKETIDGK